MKYTNEQIQKAQDFNYLYHTTAKLMTQIINISSEEREREKALTNGLYSLTDAMNFLKDELINELGSIESFNDLRCVAYSS